MARGAPRTYFEDVGSQDRVERVRCGHVGWSDRRRRTALLRANTTAARSRRANHHFERPRHSARDPAGSAVDAGCSDGGRHRPCRPAQALRKWGPNFPGVTSVPPTPVYVEVEAGGFRMLARRSDGSVACWGESPCGHMTQLWRRYRLRDTPVQSCTLLRSATWSRRVRNSRSGSDSHRRYSTSQILDETELRSSSAPATAARLDPCSPVLSATAKASAGSSNP